MSTEDPGFSRRTILRTAAGVVVATAAGTACGMATSTFASAAVSRRALLHLTPTTGWACDPQRPYYLGGQLQLPRLQAARTAGPGGWRLATSTDEVFFSDVGDTIPLVGDTPAWSGSVVVDTDNTAGLGAGAVVALVTHVPHGDLTRQAQYLHWSTDGGRSFSMLSEPVIPNPNADNASTDEEIDNARWFRDPKVVRDEVRSQWVCVIGRRKYLSFYVSTDLHHWRWTSNFDYLTPGATDLGGMECPDLFRIIADDGTSHWVLGASMDGWGAGSLGTYAYWIGNWDGTRFVTDNLRPQWLDHGYDWYAAVTWPSADSPQNVRHAVAWMNNWKYAARHVPTLDTDGYNGQYSVVREIRLCRQPGGWYSLLSAPKPVLATSVLSQKSLGDVNVTGRRVLDVTTEAYVLTTDIAWTNATNVGIEVLRSSDGTRHTNVGVFNGRVYVDRGPSESISAPFAPYTQSEAPIDPAARHVHLTVVVDRNSVEVFVNAGHTVLSNQVYPAAGDHGLALYSDNGSAVFSDLSLRTV